MSNSKSAKPKLHQIITLVLAALTTIFMVFYGSLPEKYDYTVGSIAGQDIYAPRTFADIYETERKAKIARDTSPDIFVRSDKQSEESIDRVEDFFDLTNQERKNVTQAKTTQSPLTPSEASYQLSMNVKQTLDVDISSEEILPFFEMIKSYSDKSRCEK